mmetsp:Transcript_18274/g.48519  ORF Transcript_18274/g.48519 Transcript_18274/m.48519 type:complete len:86 (-) Transcript_18274:329-586(-)
MLRSLCAWAKREKKATITVDVDTRSTDGWIFECREGYFAEGFVALGREGGARSPRMVKSGGVAMGDSRFWVDGGILAGSVRRTSQ